MVNKPLWIDNGTGPVRNPDLTQEEFDAALIELTNTNTMALWQAAHDYEYAQISGSATGLLTLGVLQSKPKSAAIMTWIQSIWTLYYSRKPTVTHEWNAALLDFSSCGTIPYSIPELMAEVLS